MNLQAYILGCDRGEFQWECLESGTYGDGNSVDIESVNLKGRTARITRGGRDSFEVEVDNLKSNPHYDNGFFGTRHSARNWAERIIKKDIKQEAILGKEVI